MYDDDTQVALTAIADRLAEIAEHQRTATRITAWMAAAPLSEEERAKVRRLIAEKLDFEENTR